MSASQDAASFVSTLMPAALSPTIVAAPIDNKNAAALRAAVIDEDRNLSSDGLAAYLFEARRIRRVRAAVFDEVYARFDQKPLDDLLLDDAVLA
jgi:hypothetical protein